MLEVGPTRTPDGQPRVAALMEHAFDPGHKERYRCEFDPARNDLPTRIVFLREEDRIGIVLDITYQEVIPGSAWFLKKATCKFFGRPNSRDRPTRRRGGRPRSSRRRGGCTSMSRSPPMRSRWRSRPASASPMRPAARSVRAARILPLSRGLR